METTVQCAVREVKEETGLDVVPIWPMGSYCPVFHFEESFIGGQHRCTAYVFARSNSDSPTNIEPNKHEDWQWKTLDELFVERGKDDWIPLPALIALRDKLNL